MSNVIATDELSINVLTIEGQVARITEPSSGAQCQEKHRLVLIVWLPAVPVPSPYKKMPMTHCPLQNHILREKGPGRRRQLFGHTGEPFCNVRVCE